MSNLNCLNITSNDVRLKCIFYKIRSKMFVMNDLISKFAIPNLNCLNIISNDVSLKYIFYEITSKMYVIVLHSLCLLNALYTIGKHSYSPPNALAEFEAITMDMDDVPQPTNSPIAG